MLAYGSTPYKSAFNSPRRSKKRGRYFKFNQTPTEIGRTKMTLKQILCANPGEVLENVSIPRNEGQEQIVREKFFNQTFKPAKRSGPFLESSPSGMHQSPKDNSHYLHISFKPSETSFTTRPENSSKFLVYFKDMGQSSAMMQGGNSI